MLSEQTDKAASTEEKQINDTRDMRQALATAPDKSVPPRTPSRSAQYAIGLTIISLLLQSTCIASFAQNGDSRKSDLEWQEKCVKKGLYSRPQRREEIQRLGISVQIPEGMDFDFDPDPNQDNIRIAEIEGMIPRKCNDMAARLHNISLPGRGISSLELRSGERFPKPGDDRFLDAVLAMGEKWPVYSDGVETWTSLVNPVNGKRIVISSYDVNAQFFYRFVSAIHSTSK